MCFLVETTRSFHQRIILSYFVTGLIYCLFVVYYILQSFNSRILENSNSASDKTEH